VLALFDKNQGGWLDNLVRSVREGYERSDPDMGEHENAHAWDEFDALWERYSSAERLELSSQEVNHPAIATTEPCTECGGKIHPGQLYVPATARMGPRHFGCR
jgi:hypothetical protein